MASRPTRAHRVLSAAARGVGAAPGPHHSLNTVAAVAAAAAAAGPTPLEWHFHVYFHLDEGSIAAADVLREKLIEAVRAGELMVVLNGVDRSVLPALTEESVEKLPGFNTRPMGPHPEGSFEVWCPNEKLGEALAFITIHRGDMTILLHPLGGDIGGTGISHQLFAFAPIFHQKQCILGDFG